MTCNGCAAKDTTISEQEQRIKELERERDAAIESWRCFHCGFETTDRKEAAGHFGDCDEVQPLCLIWAELSDHERLAECQNVSGHLAEEREGNSKLRTQIEGLEHRVEGQLSEIHSFVPFRQCDSIHQVFHVYDSMEGRALAAEEQIAELRDRLARAEARLSYVVLNRWVVEYNEINRKWYCHRDHYPALGAGATSQEAIDAAIAKSQPQERSDA